MNKTYKIQLPRNREAQNIKTNIKNGTIEVEVELKEWVPRDVEIVAWRKTQNQNKWAISVYKEKERGYCHLFTSGIVGFDRTTTLDIGEIRPATASEKQLLFDALDNEDKMWDAERKQVVDLPRWRAEDGEDYFCIMISRGKIEVYRYNNTKNCCACSLEANQDLKCNCFKTYEAAEKVVEQIREIFKNSKAE